jgi:hypothetical protein
MKADVSICDEQYQLFCRSGSGLVGEGRGNPLREQRASPS